ncbi:MAG: alpha/beta hydrolase family protein [Elusimicrobia bacterium]|nr:alpha/beta hydrolase family protein [Elusimicrobiota bacterium]MBU2614847.1 alpha/beta hydrolase family protein [Elusimicrobiota bacterium]
MKEINTKYSMVQYFIEREKEIKPGLAFNGSTKDDFQKWHNKLKNKLIELLGEFPKQVPLNSKVIARADCGDHWREKIVIDTEEHFSVPAWLLLPKDLKPNEKRPVLLGLHGHRDGGKDHPAGVSISYSDRLAGISKPSVGQELVKEGYIVFCPDSRGFGELSEGEEGNPYPGKDKCDAHFIRGLILGINLITLNIWDLIKSIDYLETRPEVASDRIGSFGLSWGGTRSTYISAIDDRIKATVVSGYSTTTKHYAIDTANFCGSQFVPQMYCYADVGDIIGLSAPKPLLLQTGIDEECFSVESGIKCHEHVKKIYSAAGEPAKVRTDLFCGGHQYDIPEIIKFFKEYLLI